MDREDRHLKWLQRDIARMNDKALRNGDNDPYYRALRGESLKKEEHTVTGIVTGKPIPCGGKSYIKRFGEDMEIIKNPVKIEPKGLLKVVHMPSKGLI